MTITWRTILIGDLGRIVTGSTPGREHADRFAGSLPFITPSDLDADRRTPEISRFISADAVAQLSRRIVPAGSICFTCIGATIGKMCQTTSPALTNQQINTVVVDQERHNAAFVYYRLLADREEIKTRAGGAATPIISKSAFEQITVRMPPLETQCKIAAILSAYDDLIENNHGRIKVLEEIAQRIYREWFVDFRFPGHQEVPLVDSELGLIPEGWAVVALGDVSKIYGGSPTTKASFVADGYTAYSAAGPDGYLVDYQVDGSGVVLSAVGARCGRTWYAAGQWSSIANTLRIHPEGDKSTAEWLYFSTLGPDQWPRRGSAQPFIAINDARARQVVLPDSNSMEEFTRHVLPSLRLVAAFQALIGRLRIARDLLLPRLISGEIDVTDLDIAMPEAAA